MSEKKGLVVRIKGPQAEFLRGYAKPSVVVNLLIALAMTLEYMTEGGEDGQ